jgi:hypothetical protein
LKELESLMREIVKFLQVDILVLEIVKFWKFFVEIVEFFWRKKQIKPKFL